MDIETLASLDSQKKFCADLVKEVSQNESFVLLAGERGSGRTVLCEQVVNETDSIMRAVFIPCHKDMQLQRLRELFLQQLLPNMDFDTNLNLPDALIKVHIPHNDKILVVVDDADVVVSSFFNELLALHEQFLGQSRFSFILVGQPLWAEEKISRAQTTSKAHLTLHQIPPLNLQESLVLARHIFALNNTMQIYKALDKRLPEILAGAKGNLSKTIAITERLMKEPTVPVNSQDVGRKNKLQINKSKKKSSSVGIFVTVVCIIIVLACLIPIFFGGNFFSDDKGSGTTAEVANENSLLLDEGNRSFDESMVTDEGVLPPSVSGGIDAETTKRQTEHSVTLSGEELDRIEGGANGSGYPRGVDRSVANTTPQVATLRRENNLNHVNVAAPQAQGTRVDVSTSMREQSAAAQQAAAAAQQQAAAAAAAALEQKQRELDAQRQAEQERAAAQQQAAAAAAAAAQKNPTQRQNLDQAAQDKIATDRARAQQNAAAQNQESKPQAQQQTASREQPRQNQAAQVQRPPLRAGQVINLADEQRQMQSARRQNKQPAIAAAPAKATGRAVEGNINEVRSIPDTHFTVQIVSSSSRANISAAAQGLSGRYWILETRYNNRPWYILLSGDYTTRDAAQAAARQIPSSVSQGATPFAKRIMDIKPEIR